MTDPKLLNNTFCVRAIQVWYKECFCSGGGNVLPKEKSFAQQEKTLEVTLIQYIQTSKLKITWIVRHVG